MKTVRDVMARDPETLTPDDTIQMAAKLMRDGDFGVVPIIDPRNVDDKGVLVGIVTDRDIVINAVANGMDSETPLERVMSKHLETIAVDTTLEQAMTVMRARQIRRLPVMEYGRLVGMVSLADIANSDVGSTNKADILEEVSSIGQIRTTGSAF